MSGPDPCFVTKLSDAVSEATSHNHQIHWPYCSYGYSVVRDVRDGSVVFNASRKATEIEKLQMCHESYLKAAEMNAAYWESQ